MRAFELLLVLSVLSAGCTPANQGAEPAPVPPALAAESEPPSAAPPTPPASPPAAESPARAPGPEIVLAATGGASVQDQVRSALSTAEADDRRLVVYVGATWCEPCRRFHDAVKAGQLDSQLAGVRFLEFDHDTHHDGLEAAGYIRRFVPLFAIPEADGRASSRVHHGAVKGPGAVDFILPRLRALLEP